MTPDPITFSVVTFGCRVNQADSLAVVGDLRARGAIEVAPADADLVVVNTCSVTAAADQGARQTIRRLARDNPDVQVVVTGCYATRQPDELCSLPNLVAVVSNDDKDSLVDRVAPRIGLGLDSVTTATRFGLGDGPCGEALTPGAAGRTALTLRVQTGCDERCSYCIIPWTRGRGRSTPLPAVIRRIEHAVAAGYREIAITGVHLGSYGRDLSDGTSLTRLINVLAGWDGDVLFRISSLEPMDCTTEIIDQVATSPRLAPHFHLPLQHGADAMLRAMERPYTARAYAALAQHIHHAVPHASIGTDLIVGFPGESDTDVEETAALLEELPLSYMHVFPYSDRPGTAATSMKGKVDGATIRQRGQRMRTIAQRMSERFRQSQRGSRRRALTVDDGWSAVTDNYLKVRLEERHARNEWVQVLID